MENKVKNSEDFINQLVNKTNGFSTPKNYFGDAEDRFSSFIVEEQFSNENAFSTPKDYFDDLENTIVNNVIPKKKTKIISLKNRLLKYIPIATAASVALFLSINFFNPTNKEISFDSIAQTDIENWIIDNSNELTDQEFATLLNNEIVNENDLALTDLQNDDIEEYIINSENTSFLDENY